MKVGLLTGGGDAPGLNGILESASRILLRAGHEVYGIEDGFEGVFEGRVRKLSLKDVMGIHSLAGTFLGTSNKCGTKGRESEFLAKYRALGLNGLIVAGGDGTFLGLEPFRDEIPILGVPKTIDNDISGTEFTFGYDTACSVVAEAVDALRATAEAHRRIIVVEVMGRTAGWIALGGGLASYADAILIPERPYSRSELVAAVRKRHASGARAMMIVAAEGASAIDEKAEVAFVVPGSPQPERLGGIGASLAKWLEKETGWEARHVVLGHLQRAHHPTATDRFMTLAMGVEVARLANEGIWRQAVVYRGGRIVHAPIADLMGPARLVDPHHHWIELAQSLGTFI